jgi:hypothetical protein
LLRIAPTNQSSAPCAVPSSHRTPGREAELRHDIVGDRMAGGGAAHDVAEPYGAVVGHEHRLARNQRLAARALHTGNPPAMLIEGEGRRRHHEPADTGRMPLLLGHQRGDEQPIRIVAVAGERPAAMDLVTALDGRAFAGRHEGSGHEIVGAFAPDLGLRLDRPIGGQPCVHIGDHRAPAGAAAGPADFEAQADQRGGAELISAETARLAQPIEPCIHQQPGDLGRDPAFALGLLCPFREHRAQHARALQQAFQRWAGRVRGRLGGGRRVHRILPARLLRDNGANLEGRRNPEKCRRPIPISEIPIYAPMIIAPADG